MAYTHFVNRPFKKYFVSEPQVRIRIIPTWEQSHLKLNKYVTHRNSEAFTNKAFDGWRFFVCVFLLPFSPFMLHRLLLICYSKYSERILFPFSVTV